MCIEYEIECTACNYKWEVLGDGCFVVNLNNSDNRCSKCGCQVLIVIYNRNSDIKPQIVDFTEQNIALAEKERKDFNTIMDAFVKLNSLAEDSTDYINLKNWISEQISIRIYESSDAGKFNAYNDNPKDMYDEYKTNFEFLSKEEILSRVRNCKSILYDEDGD